MHNNLTKWGCQEATIINRLMGKGKDFKRKAETLIELCKNVKAQTPANYSSHVYNTLLQFLNIPLEKRIDPEIGKTVTFFWVISP